MDLPGHGAKPGNLATSTIGEWVNSVVTDIEEAGLGDIVIVGHSMAGVTVPGVVAKLGSARVREMILATAFMPPQGGAIVDTLGGPLAWFARRDRYVWRQNYLIPIVKGVLAAKSPQFRMGVDTFRQTAGIARRLAGPIS